LVFAVNLHPSESYWDLWLPVPDPTDYHVVLDSDDKAFGGLGRISNDLTYPWQHIPVHGRNQSVRIYLPSRTAQVMAPVAML
jgi:1,4-alpha-glucan branching enzyme